MFARRFGLVNASYQFPPIPEVDWIRLQISGDYARVSFFSDHSLPHRNLFGAGVDAIFALTAFTRNATLVIGYGYGFDAPRNDGAGGQEAHGLFEKMF